VEANPSESKITITWDWSSVNVPAIPSGFIIERDIDGDGYSLLSYTIDPTARTYDDVLSSANAIRAFVDGDSITYRIRAYWLD